MGSSHMTVEDAILVVLELARENVLTEKEVLEDLAVLGPEREYQQLAISTLYDHMHIPTADRPE